MPFLNGIRRPACHTTGRVLITLTCTQPGPNLTCYFNRDRGTFASRYDVTSECGACGLRQTRVSYAALSLPQRTCAVDATSSSALVPGGGGGTL